METASQKERKLINFWAKRKKNIVALSWTGSNCYNQWDQQEKHDQWWNNGDLPLFWEFDQILWLDS